MARTLRPGRRADPHPREAAAAGGRESTADGQPGTPAADRRRPDGAIDGRDAAAVSARLRPGVWSALGSLGAASMGALAIGTPAARRRDRWADVDLYELGVDRGCIVAAVDGVPLAVRESGPVDAPVTVVFAHGYTLTMDTWHFQRRSLTERFGDRVRMVFYDQRGHGQSGGTPRTDATIGQLATDLKTVLDSTAPRGSVVLIGHSMGGMTVMALAARHPELFRERVRGVGLVATAAGKLTDSGLGSLLETRSLDSLAGFAGRTPGVFHGGRRATALAVRPFIAAGSFGEPGQVSPTVARFVDHVIGHTDIETIAYFYDTLVNHDETAGLPALVDVRTAVICGDRDLLTPLDRSVEIARELPDAEFVVVPGAGHMVMLEQPELVSGVLGDVIDDVLSGGAVRDDAVRGGAGGKAAGGKAAGGKAAGGKAAGGKDAGGKAAGGKDTGKAPESPGR